jgi:lactoylglutathione lyase
MVRVKDLDESLNFYCTIFGMQEVSRFDHEAGRFTLIFLAAPGDVERAKEHKAPTLELTYNWPDENGNQEDYDTGRNFGHLAYRVDNIYETCQHLMDNGITINRPPRDGHMAFIKSPDNISIELLQKGDALEPQEPWASMENSGEW